MGGKPVVPNEVKKKRGTLRADRAPVISLKASLPRVGTAEPPFPLGPIATEAWHRIIGRAGEWIAISDRDALAMLCQALEFHADLGARIAADGPVLFTEKGYAYPHPAVGMRQTCEDAIRKWMATLGLTAADRTKLGIAMVETQSKLERYAQMHQAASQRDGRRAG